MPFKNDTIYRKVDRSEIQAHGQTFVIYEMSIGFVSHRLLLEQFEAWVETKGRYLTGLDNIPENTRHLRDLAWHIWYRGRLSYDTSQPRRRLSKNFGEVPLPWHQLITDDLRPVFKDSTFWLAERVAWDCDLGHIWKLLINPLHLARTRADLENLLLNDAPSHWRTVLHARSSATNQWMPDRPSLRWD